MKQEIKIFKHEMFGEVRTMTNEKGETFFVGSDVAKALGYAKPQNALASHVDDEDKTTAPIQGTGSNYKTNVVIINESGLYSLVLSSKLDQAREFKRWVTAEVLPAIRRTGHYQLSSREVKQLAQQAEYCQQVLQSVSCYTMTQVAKEMGMSVYDLTRRLLCKGLIYFQSGNYMLYADFARQGLARTRTDHHTGRDGHVHTNMRLVWTEQGRKKVHEVIDRDRLKDMELELLEFC